jgi:hypothetical protein
MKMKNRADLETALKIELERNWFPQQCREPFSDFYLYYLPTTTEHYGRLSICKDNLANPEMKLATAQRINKGASVEQNFNWLRCDVIGTLPVLTID